MPIKVTPEFTSSVDTQLFFMHENSGSTSQNRIYSPTAGPLIVENGASMVLRYDVSKLRWIPLVVPSNIVGDVIASLQTGWTWTDMYAYGAGSGTAIIVSGGGSVAWSSFNISTKVQGTVLNVMIKAIGIVSGTVTSISIPAVLPIPTGSVSVYPSTHKWLYMGNVYGAKGAGYDYEVLPVVHLASDFKFYFQRESGNFVGDSGTSQIEIQVDFTKDFI